MSGFHDTAPREIRMVSISDCICGSNQQIVAMQRKASFQAWHHPAIASHADKDPDWNLLAIRPFQHVADQSKVLGEVSPWSHAQ